MTTPSSRRRGCLLASSLLASCAAPPEATAPATSERAVDLSPSPAGHLLVQLSHDGEALSWVRTTRVAGPLPPARADRGRGWRVEVSDASGAVVHRDRIPEPRRLRVPPPPAGGAAASDELAVGRVDLLVRLPALDAASVTMVDEGTGKVVGSLALPAP